jgi:sporulation-control protein spo0M
MKGFYFAKPLEYRLEIPTDTFVQDSLLQGQLGVTNRDSAPQKNLTLEIGLAYGVFKEIKESGARALKMLERHKLAAGFTLKPGEEKRVAFELQLTAGAPIQSKEGSPFLLYGGELETAGARGQIDLPVALAPPFESFITTLENHFAFEARSRRCVEGVIEVHCKPPSSYPTLDELVILFRIDGENVEVEFDGKGKGLARGEGGGVATRRMNTRKSLPRTTFSLPNAMPNRPLYRELIQTMLPKIAIRVEKKG